MGLADRFGAPVSHQDIDDVDAFGEAAELMLAYRPDPVGSIKALLEKSPNFVMARCFLAGIFLTASDQRRQGLMKQHLEVLKTQVSGANDRERQHIAALDFWAKGDFYASSQAYADILNAYPRDLIALQVGHQTDFMLGHVTSTRDRPARVRNHWSDADPQLSFVLGMHAFGMEEAGHYVQAQELAEKAVSLNSNDCWSVHALAHCFEMQGKAERGIAIMDSHEQHWGDDNYMSIHNRWHLMLFHMEQGAFDHALKVHDQYMAVTPKSELMDAHDSVALLQRLSIAGVDVGSRWDAAADLYTPVLDQAYMAFTDIHAMMAFAAAGREAEAKGQLAALEHVANNGSGTSANVIRMAGLPLVRGFHAFGQGDYAAASQWLSSARHNSRLIGGSDAQRDVINQTLLAAALRNGDNSMAKALIAERTAMRPHSPLIDMFAQRAA